MHFFSKLPSFENRAENVKHFYAGVRPLLVEVLNFTLEPNEDMFFGVGLFVLLCNCFVDVRSLNPNPPILPIPIDEPDKGYMVYVNQNFRIILKHISRITFLIQQSPLPHQFLLHHVHELLNLWPVDQNHIPRGFVIETTAMEQLRTPTDVIQLVNYTLGQKHLDGLFDKLKRELKRGADL